MQNAALALAVILAFPAAALADSPRLTLEQLTNRAQQGPRARMARSDTQAAEVRTRELSSAILPRIDLDAFVTPGPRIDCVDADCVRTDPDGPAWAWKGVWAGVGLTVVQPLYAPGKLGPGKSAVRAGIAAQRALEDESAGDVAVEAARAYWGLKLARELRYMLEDGIEQLGGARERLVERLAEGDGEATIQDQQRLDTILAEARIQLEDAQQGEDIALAAVRILAGDDTADIDEAPIDVVAYDLAEEAGYLTRARRERPQVIAAAEGARAAAALAELEASEYWPSLSLYGDLYLADATGVDDPPNYIYSDPYHRFAGSLSLMLRWKIEPWNTRHKVARARAAARKASALADLAKQGATLDQRTAYAEATRARRRVDAATTGENAARAWVAALVQADAVGTAEAKDLAEAYLGWFQMRARLANAIFQWNVAVVRLERAVGGYRALR